MRRRNFITGLAGTAVATVVPVSPIRWGEIISVKYAFPSALDQMSLREAQRRLNAAYRQILETV